RRAALREDRRQGRAGAKAVLSGSAVDEDGRRVTNNSSFRGGLQLHRRPNPEPGDLARQERRWVPGSTADEAGAGPGMTVWETSSGAQFKSNTSCHAR